MTDEGLGDRAIPMHEDGPLRSLLEPGHRFGQVTVQDGGVRPLRRLKRAGSDVLGHGVDPVGVIAIAIWPDLGVHVVGAAPHQQGVAVAQLLKSDGIGFVIDEIEMPAIHVVDHAVEADEGRVDNLSHGDLLRERRPARGTAAPHLRAWQGSALTIRSNSIDESRTNSGSPVSRRRAGYWFARRACPVCARIQSPSSRCSCRDPSRAPVIWKKPWIIPR